MKNNVYEELEHAFDNIIMELYEITITTALTNVH
jgi:hypothetical protein